MNDYLKDISEVLKETESDINGLTSQQVEQKHEKYGKNKLDEPEKKTVFQKFISALADPMIIMLIVAAGISTATTIYQNIAQDANESYADLFIILFVVIINTILSLVQESKAEQAIEALKEMTAATSKIIRDGSLTVIKSEDVTIGDIVVLEAGDAIPADCRIIESYSLKVEEAALTGESVPVNKVIDILTLKENTLDIPLGDRVNMLYAGSTIVYGRGKAVVTGIGMNTEMGKIASALNQAVDEKTPLQKKMSELSNMLTKLVVGICAFVFVFGVVRELIIPTDAKIFDVILNTFIMSVALAVAAIPEGLPAVVTIVLSIGVTSMSKRNALIRKLTAVETLGCTQIICSDKTGTLTQNRMTVVDHFTNDEILLAKGMALCSDAKILEGETQATGEPTEAALVNYAYRLKMPSYQLDTQYPRVGEAPFDSQRKMMSTIVKDDKKFTQFTKGATEIIIDLCDYYLDEYGNQVKITNEYKELIKKQMKLFADRALRVLGLATVSYDQLPKSFEAESLENHLTFVGFVGMIDPCRQEVKPAIKECKSAGIHVVMITGDHIDTATAIGKDLGIIDNSNQAMIGSDIEDLTDEQLIETLKTVCVFARVQPEHKTRIVKAFQSQGYVCAMTGDGVNDAPSIKAADIGIGMGITGTDVTKGVSDMVLADDNFATIVNAVEEGRKIYDNVRKVIQFQLSTNMAEVIAIFVSSALGINVLSAAHLLWINMVTDSAPGLALGMEKAENNLMQRKPRSSNESVFSHGAGIDMVIQGLFMGCLIILSFFVGDYLQHQSLRSLSEIVATGSIDGMTMAFLTTNFIEIFHAVSMRSQRGSLFKLKSFNWWLLAAVIVTIFLTIGVIYIPVFRDLFELTSISFNEFCIAFAIAFSVIPVLEIVKWILRKVSK